jgi:hypothetical protein
MRHCLGRPCRPNELQANAARNARLGTRFQAERTDFQVYERDRRIPADNVPKQRLSSNLFLSGTAAGPRTSVPAFAAGTALWAALALIRAGPQVGGWLRLVGGAAACLFAITAGRIYAREVLSPTSSPLPFFAYPFSLRH